MGQTLSAPVTDKRTEQGSDERFAWAATDMQGWRINMEDAHVAVLDLEADKGDPPPSEEVKEQGKTSFFAVYDGHGGASVARYAGRTLHKRLATNEHYEKRNYADALKKAFLGTDEALRADPQFRNDPSGCTAITLLVTPEDVLYAANAGDSRAVLCSKGFVKDLSTDHKPHGQTESARIRAAGGWVEYGRVNGNLALSRAIGDFEYKKNLNLGPEHQIVTADPEVLRHQLDEDDEFIVLACDGIWDCLSSQATCDYVRRHVAKRMPLGELCEKLVEHCLSPDADLEKSGIGCDNMTVIIVAILHGRTLEEWYDWMVDRVDVNKVGRETPSFFAPLYAHSRGGYHWGSSRVSFDLRIPVYADDSSDEDMDEDDEDSLFGRVSNKSSEDGSLLLKAQEEIAGRETEAEASGSGSRIAQDEHERDMEDEERSDDELPPGFTSNRLTSVGSPIVSTHAALKDISSPGKVKPEEQLKSIPGGDAASPAVKVEGFMDKSEDPLRSA